MIVSFVQGGVGAPGLAGLTGAAGMPVSMKSAKYRNLGEKN